MVAPLTRRLPSISIGISPIINKIQSQNINFTSVLIALDCLLSPRFSLPSTPQLDPPNLHPFSPPHSYSSAPLSLLHSNPFLNQKKHSIMQSVNRFFFGPTPDEKVKKWQQDLRSESRKLDREIRQLDSAANKTKVEVKKLALKGDVKNAKVLAREVVRSNKQKDRLHTSQARLSSIGMQLTHQLGWSLLLYTLIRIQRAVLTSLATIATVKITGTLQKSTEIMKLSNQLVKLPELSATMRAMSEEMMKVFIFYSPSWLPFLC